MPGDVIDIDFVGGVATLTEEILQEDYIAELTNFNMTLNFGNVPEHVCMGDNRNHSRTVVSAESV